MGEEGGRWLTPTRQRVSLSTILLVFQGSTMEMARRLNEKRRPLIFSGVPFDTYMSKKSSFLSAADVLTCLDTYYKVINPSIQQFRA